MSSNIAIHISIPLYPFIFVTALAYAVVNNVWEVVTYAVISTITGLALVVIPIVGIMIWWFIVRPYIASIILTPTISHSVVLAIDVLILVVLISLTIELIKCLIRRRSSRIDFLSFLFEGRKI